MGYAESLCLIYGRDGFGGAALSVHYQKVLGELAPYAAYIVDDTPFVLFYEETTDDAEQKRINRKIWNAQIPITIVCGTSNVKIYSSCSIDRQNSTFEEVISLLSNEINENSPFSYWEITSHRFWIDYTEQFSGEKLNDHLLCNLSDITKRLREDYHVSFATKLILRLIFIRYLIDRGVDLDYKGFNSDVGISRNNLLKLLTDKAELYILFTHLKGKFNGNLFELDSEVDASCLTIEVLQVLSDFFSANVDTKTGQLSLFDLYDFNIIPVELISNIYEILLGKEKREKDNAFYTPQYLVDYILDGSVSRFIRDNGTCRVLDPSCGSGIFLVESYRRMVERELGGTPYAEDDKMLQNILSENIYGVDLNKDAIDVAIFSLYLAVLDYKNPKTLKQFKLPNLKGENLFIADFFDEDALSPLKVIPFDFIVGNPPWGSQNGLHVDYCKRRGYAQFLQNNDTCRSFVLRSKDFCTINTQCCFVLHSKMLYMQKNPSKRFRAFLLANAKIARVIELSSVRKLVFKNADAPAVILTYSFPDNASLENRFEYISMKPNLFFKLFNLLVIEKTDIKYVQQKLLAENDWAWKTLVYGLSGDIDTISYLQKSFSTVARTIEEQLPKLIVGTGVQYNDGDRKDASHLIGKDFLPSESLDHFTINLAKLNKFEKPCIHRTRNESLFHAPYCLLLTGIDMKDYTMRSAFSDVDFIFREVIFAVKGCDRQKPFLLNLTGLFNSSLFAYLNLMLGSFAGIEREKRLVKEVLEFPFVYSDSIAKQVEAIQEMSIHEDFTVAQDISGEVEKLNKMILEAFNLSDNSFVDYALKIQIPQLTNLVDCEGFHAVNSQQLRNYAKPFFETLSAVYGVSGKFVTANIYPTITKYYSAIEVDLHDSKPSVEIQVIDDSTLVPAALTRLSAHRINDMFFEVRDVIYFDEDSFYIIKPNYYKNWHPAIAQLDLADVINQILSRNRGNN
ncbi:MAG: N-6 DNA methylase [Clostridiales bacterium]|nr:N-6 DNA methylase [Clostridiales bacterium]